MTLCRIALYALFVTLVGYAGEQSKKNTPTENPEHYGWRGLSEPNLKYDWLRPPKEIRDGILKNAHAGLLGRDVDLYSYSRTIWFEDKRSVNQLSLTTPVSRIMWLGIRARQQSRDVPGEEEVLAAFGSLRVQVHAHSMEKGDYPSLWLTDGSTLIDSEPRERVYERVPASGPGWDNSRLYLFRPPDGLRMKGAWHFLLRWGTVERTVAVNLDYLW